MMSENEMVILGDILHMEKGKKPQIQSTKFKEGLQPYVDIKAFEKGIIDNYASTENAVLCQDGDLLIVCDGSRSGMTGRAIKGVVCSTLAKIYADGLDTDYLRYFIQSKYILLNTREKGTGTPHLNTDILKTSKIFVPSMEEQKRIVSRIEEMFSELDNAEEILQATESKLEAFCQVVLKDAFDSCTGYSELSKIGDIKLGKMLDRKKNKGTFRNYLRNANVKWLSFDLSDLQQMKITDEESERYAISKGDLVICEGGEPGRCAVWERDDTIFYQKALHRVRFNNQSNPKFYMYYFWYISHTGELSKFFTGTGIKHLTVESLKKVPVPNLNINLQNDIVKQIEFKISAYENTEQTVDLAIQQCRSLRQSVLRQAFEGDLE